MIDVKNLMTGNFVKHDDDIVDVYKIYSCGIGNDCGDYYYDDEIDGIEVTEEMLEKIGFSKQEEMGVFEMVHFFRYWDKDYRYKLDVNGGPNNSGRKWYVHIDNGDCNTIGCGDFTYLHELMNLTRVISGFDLRITKDMLYD